MVAQSGERTWWHMVHTAIKQAGRLTWVGMAVAGECGSRTTSWRGESKGQRRAEHREGVTETKGARDDEDGDHTAVEANLLN